MFSKPFIVAVAVASALVSGAPLETRSAALTPAQLELLVIDVAVTYQSIGDHAALIGQAPQLQEAVTKLYNKTVEAAKPVPQPAGKTIPRKVQLTLCGDETFSVIQALEAHSILRKHVDQFNAAQKKEIVNIVAKDRKDDAQFGPTFAKYVPACSAAILKNHRLTEDSYKTTQEIFEGKT